MKESEAGIPVKELCRKYGMENSTFYKWCDKYGGMETSDIKRFNNLEQARRITEEWLTIYNTERPHEALNNMTPIEYKTLKQAV